MTTRPWPSRDEWQATAEYQTRTQCYPWQRVPHGPAPYLSDAEIAELVALDADLAKITRPVVMRKIKELRQQLADWPEPTDAYGWYEWFDALPEAAQQAFNKIRELEPVRTALYRRARGKVPVEDLIGHRDAVLPMCPDAAGSARHHELLQAWRERRDAAAEAATEQAVAREVARRASDAGWQQELDRRAYLDAWFQGAKVSAGETTP